MRLGGAIIARLRLATETTEPGRARGELVMQAAGVGSWLDGDSQARMRAELRLADGEPRPHLFQVRYEKPDRYRDIQIRFDPETGAIVALRYDNNGRLRDSEVPAALRQGTVDPVTAFFVLRRWVEAPHRRPRDTITVPVFDGRKRLDVLVEYLRSGSAGGVELRARLIGHWGFEDGFGFVETDSNPGPVWLDVSVLRGTCTTPLWVRGGAGLLGSSLTLEPRLRQPRRRRSLCPAAAAGVRRPRTSRARCRSRRSAHP